MRNSRKKFYPDDQRISRRLGPIIPKPASFISGVRFIKKVHYLSELNELTQKGSALLLQQRKLITLLNIALNT
ncbi:hypothetical protein BK139_01150 [Paenibacillus sp. FSL R5-0490]|nr:hypothetical protein BK139_01150 [Paenibacillus sp. FSL R5-0490]